MKLSIIITAWNIENFIEQALESCLQDGAGPCEILVIDNGSDDRTVALTERFMAGPGKNMDIQIIRHDSNRGPGEARNTGLDHATGDYVLFLDGDDWFLPDTLTVLRDHLEKKRPEVLIYSYRRSYPDGALGRDSQSPILSTRMITTVEDRQKLMRKVFPVAWNKAYARSFLLAGEFRFSDSLYEDVSWSFNVMLLARRLMTLSLAVVAYRQRPRSITRSSGEDHFAVLGEYRRVLDYLQTDAGLCRAYGAMIYGYARQQMLYVLQQGRIPTSMRGRYLSEMFAEITLWRAALAGQGVSAVSGRDLAQQIYRRGGPAVFQAYIRLRGIWATNVQPVVSATGQALRRAGGWLRRLPRKALYLAAQRRPMQPKKVFFESYWGAKADCNPLAIAKALDRQGGYDIVWSFAPGAVIPKDFPWRHVRRGSAAMLREAADAGYFVSNTNLHDDIVKRPGATHLQTWHGTPVKLMGLDIRPVNKDEMNWEAFVTRSLRWDYVLSSNPHSSRVWRRACPYDYHMLETGYPRNDIFFRSDADHVAAIRARLGIPPGKKVALYAPTVRDDLRGQPLPLQPDVFDAAAVAEALGPDWVLLIRAHYFLRNTDGSAKNALDVSAYSNSNEIALISDLLITDYSSLMFDYACLRRPIVLYHYDYADYTARRGVYFHLSDIPPGPIAADLAGLLEILAGKTFDSAEHHARIEEFAARFAPWDDGHSAERVLHSLFGVKPAV